MDEVRELLAQVLSRLARLESGPQESEFLTVTQAAYLAAVSEKTIRRRLKDGGLRRYGKGKSVRIRRAELLALFEVQPETPTDRIDEILSRR